MKKIKVLRIIARLNIGGPAIHTLLLNSEMNEDRFENILVTGTVEEKESDMMYLAKEYKVTPIFIPEMSREIRMLQDFISFVKLYKLIRNMNPDVVHTHTAKAGSLGRLAAYFAGSKYIVHTFHGNIFKGYFGKIKTYIFKILERMFSKISTKIIAISRKQKDELAELKIAPSSKINIINLGFNFKNIIPKSSNRNKFKSYLNLPEESKIVAIIGRLVPIKNHLLFIEIATELVKKYDNLYFTIIGDGKNRNKLEEEVRKRGLSKRIFFTGFVKDLQPVYADIDVLLLTSKNEGTPVAVIEAMVSGNIVITTKVGGIEDFVKDKINGFICDTNKPGPFINTINDIFNPEAKYDCENIKENASITAFRKFHYKKLISKIENLYLELIYEKTK